MKDFLKEINASPSKRLYLSIIADYHLELALCELIDNAIDNWIINGKTEELIIDIDLDYDRQTICVKDNSGGIKEEDISLIVSPGFTRENESSEIIGVFGVGSKRAVVALAEEIKVYSRFSNEKTLLVEINDAWIKDEDNWQLPTYEVDSIDEDNTFIELTKLRDKIIETNESELRYHISSTYALYINDGGIKINLNNNTITAITYENWSYPPGFEPKHAYGPIDFGDKGMIQVSILGGLTKSHRKDSHTGIDEYGVYFYCNNRLISRAYKGPEVGFKLPRIGGPHNSKSLARVIVKLSGPVELMPWNSSKSGIDFKHRVFKEIEKHIERMLFSYVSASKSWSGEWPEKVFQYSTGIVHEEMFANFSRSVNIHAPTVPRGIKKRKYLDILRNNNRTLSQRKPWIIGTYETEVAVEQILQLKLAQNLRIAMLLLDSSLEIAFKDYLVNDSGNTYSETRLANIMKNRTEVHNEIKSSRTNISNQQWRKIEYFYRLRCDLIHKRSTVSISEDDFNTFRETYKYTIRKLFNVNFERE